VTLTWAVVVAATAAVTRAGADAPLPYTVHVDDVTAKVGDQAVMTATLTLRPGYRWLTAYFNRAIQFSSLDDGVAFENKMVRAEMQEDRMVFPVAVSPTKPGKHPINGVLRFGYIDDDTFWEISVPLIANVTGTN